MAGGAADCQFWERKLTAWCKVYELNNGERVPVAAAAQMLQNMISQYKGRGLSMGTMVVGWDKTGQSLYAVEDDGTILKGQMFSSGSGSTYAYGILDTHFNYNMTKQQAIELGRLAIYHATHRDSGSGGVVRVYHFDSTGNWEKIIEGENVDKIHWEIAAMKGLRGDGNEIPQKLF
jgi:20S proteasome subunit beta 5